MPKFQNETQSFRHRGFEDVENDKIVMMFGDGTAPVDSQGVELKKLWDHDVNQVITVSDRV